MKKILLIGILDLRLLLKRKVAYVWLLVMPIVFVGFIGIANRPGDGPSNPQPRVLIDNLDTGFFGTLLMEELNAQGMWLAGEDEREEVEREVQKLRETLRER